MEKKRIQTKLRKGIILLAGIFLLSTGISGPKAEAITSDDMDGYVKITSVEDMNKFIKDVNKDESGFQNKYVCLMNDIKYDKTVNNFQQISKFAGTFDGMGHSISGINMTSLNATGKNFTVAMFGEVTSSGLIRNLEIKDSVFRQEENYYTYELKNSAVFANTNSGSIDQCIVAADTTVEYTSNCGNTNSAGFVNDNDGWIINCGMEGTIHAINEPAGIGGIAYENSGKLQNSYMTGNLDYGCAFAYKNDGVIENVYQVKDKSGTFQWSVSQGNGTGNSYYYPAEYKNGGLPSDKLYNGSVPVDNMKSSDFVKQLISTKGDSRSNHEWIIDSKRNNGYPVLKPIYTVLLNGGTEKGKTTAENPWYYAGETVKISGEANAGFQYNGIKVTDSKGNTVDTYKSGNDYCFVMPADYVNVDGDFSEIKVSQITFSKDSYSLNKGYDMKLKATVLPEDAKVKKVTYVSSDPSIAEVEDDGTVIGKAEGMVQITVTATDGSNVQTVVNVTVTKVKAKNIWFNASSRKIAQDDSFTIKTTFKPSDVEDKSLSYVSTNTKIATVNKSGFVKGIRPGMCYIKVTTQDGSNITKKVKVIVLPKKVRTIRTRRAGSKNRIAWSKVSGASGYSVYRSSSSRGIFHKIDMTGSGKRYTYDKSVDSGVTYYYMVRAYKTVKGRIHYGKVSPVSSVRR